MSLARLLSWPQRRPFGAALLVGTAKAAACDLLVQKAVERRETVDRRRLLVFSAFGCTFCGCWQYWLFTKFMPRVCSGAEAFAAKPIAAKLRDAHGCRMLATQVFIENGVNNVVFYFPCFYTTQSLLEGGTLADGLARFRANVREDLPAIWSVWVPAQIVNFGVSPMYLRVPFTACVSLLWTSYVSFSRGAYEATARS